jgi:The GLUG motif
VKEEVEVARSLIAAIILCIGLSGGSLYAYSGGSGTASDPYQIASSQDLIELGDTPADYDKHFVLVTDIDLSDHTFDRAVIAGDSGTSEGAFDGVPFTGALVGDGCVIRNLHVEGEEFLGLFGYLATGAVVRDLGLENVSIQGAGGWVGGLLGYNHHGSVSNCYCTGAVTGGGYVGGMVGSSLAGSVSNCYSTAKVTGRGNAVGGLAGGNFYASISDSYSTGSVIGNNTVGGLLGYNYGSVSNCYSTGAVAASGTSIGGLVGSSLFSRGVTNCFWDMETSGRTSSARGTGLTTAQMQSVSTFVNAGWDFVGETGNGVAEVWQMAAAGGYPELGIFQGYEPVTPQGQGTATEPFLITNPEELASLRYRPEAYYRLDTDISLSGMTWTVAPIPSFSGHCDGNGHVIRNLKIRGGGYLGLFGFLGGRAIVMNLGLEDSSIRGNEDNIGSLAGLSAGHTANCYSISDVEGHGMIGGLFGATYGGTTADCYSLGAVSGNFRVGGLIGESSNSDVHRCYSAGAVSGAVSGGLVGANLAGRVTQCVWDVDASGTDGSDGGAGFSTAEMMDPEMLGLNGFANETDWVLDPGQDYPRLAWEGTDGQIIPDPTIDWISGTGTPEEPFEIESVAQLTKIGKSSLLWDKDLVLLADLDLDPNLPGNGVLAQAMIPSFVGRFDGGHHTIRNLHIVGIRHLGFFGILNEGAEVADLLIEGVSIEGTWDRIGGLAGEARAASVVGCSSTGTLSGDHHIGGLVGAAANATLAMSQAECEVSGRSEIGGLVGGVAETTVSQCCSSGNVSGIKYIGGLIGDYRYSETNNCYSTADVVDTDDYAGGLIGYSHESSIRNCYSTGVVRGRFGYVGGLVGRHHRGYADRSFWDVETSGQSDSATGSGLTTTEMRNRQTYLNAGWDFAEETANGSDDLWRMPPGKGYPLLVSQGEIVTSFATEGFESGTFSSLDWASIPASRSWHVTASEAHTGNYSAQAGNTGDDESSLLVLTLDCVAGNISFFVKMSCEYSYDKLLLRIDDTVMGQWSGETNWVEVSIPVQAGSRFFEWVYVKDGSSSAGDDTAWIDNITFPSEVWTFVPEAQ